MTGFELLTLISLAGIVALLVRIERVLKALLANSERQALEAKVRDFMPTLWVDPEFRDNIIPWYVLATGPYSQSRKMNWHWPTIEDNLSTTNEPKRWEIPPNEIERLKNLSIEFSREAESSHLLTDLEVRYLLFCIWNSHFRLTGMIIPDDVRNFEDELSAIRKHFLTNKGK
jgi:hypothetical protein